MSDWKDRVADALASGETPKHTGKEPGPGPLLGAFDELAAGLREALDEICARAGVQLGYTEDEGGARLHWQYLTRSLMLRMERDDGRFVLSVTTDREYDHVELWIEAGRLVSYQRDQQSRADLPDLVETFVTRFLLDSPQETP